MLIAVGIMAGVLMGYLAGLLFIRPGSGRGLFQGRYAAAFLGGMVGLWASLSGDSNEPIVWESVVSRVQSESDMQALLARSADEPILVEFYAQWCGPCRRLAPELNRLAAEGHSVAVVNVALTPGLADAYHVQAVPTLLVLHGGKVAVRTMGYHSPGELRRLLEAFPARAA